MGSQKDLSRLIEQQNLLLARQNELLERLAEQKNFGDVLLEGEKIYVEDMWHDEIRCGFPVTSRRKRMWNIQLNLIVELDRICKRYDIRYFAYGGTLLGAVRHKGFVPWDDDVDIAMLRPEYEKFKRVVTKEIREPYFVDAWHDYKIEGEEDTSEPSLQIVKIYQRINQATWWPPGWPMIKLKDSRTTFIRYPDRPHIHQGIWIDVFPFDPVPPFEDEQHEINFEVEREMLYAITMPNEIRKAISKNIPMAIDSKDIENFLKLNHRQKARTYDNFALENYSPSKYVGQIRTHVIKNKPMSFPLKNFAEPVYLPFEKIQIPAPIGYEENLTVQYGDWQEIVIYKPHATFFSTDFSYKDYFNSVKVPYREEGF